MHYYGCVMLAGGRGSRMGGCNKAELEYERHTFAERIEAELSAAGMPCYLSTAIFDQTLPDGWTLVTDDVADNNGRYIGPLGGILSCLKRASEDGLGGLFFAPCDAPMYSRKVIEKIMEAVGAGSEDVPAEKEPVRPDAVVFRTGDGRLQTTSGWYSVSCIDAFEDDIRKGGYKLMRCLDRIDCLVLDTYKNDIDDSYFLNINSVDEYRELIGGKPYDKRYKDSCIP